MRLVRQHQCLRTVLVEGDHTSQIVHRAGPVVIVWSGGVSCHKPTLRTPAPGSQGGDGDNDQGAAHRLHPGKGGGGGLVRGGYRGDHARQCAIAH